MMDISDPPDHAIEDSGSGGSKGLDSSGREATSADAPGAPTTKAPTSGVEAAGDEDVERIKHALKLRFKAQTYDDGDALLDSLIARIDLEREEVKALRVYRGMWDHAEKELEAERARADALAEEKARLLKLVEEQAIDEGLWFLTATAPEAYLQQALRRLHEAIEGKTQEKCAREFVSLAEEVERLREALAETIRDMDAWSDGAWSDTLLSGHVPFSEETKRVLLEARAALRKEEGRPGWRERARASSNSGP